MRALRWKRRPTNVESFCHAERLGSFIRLREEHAISGQARSTSLHFALPSRGKICSCVCFYFVMHGNNPVLDVVPCDVTTTTTKRKKKRSDAAERHLLYVRRAARFDRNVI